MNDQWRIVYRKYEDTYIDRKILKNPPMRDGEWFYELQRRDKLLFWNFWASVAYCSSESESHATMYLEGKMREFKDESKGIQVIKEYN